MNPDPLSGAALLNNCKCQICGGPGALEQMAVNRINGQVVSIICPLCTIRAQVWAASQAHKEFLMVQAYQPVCVSGRSAYGPGVLASVQGDGLVRIEGKT